MTIELDRLFFSASPGPNALNVLRGANIEVKFAYDIDSTSLTGATVKGFGSKTGFLCHEYSVLFRYEDIID